MRATVLAALAAGSLILTASAAARTGQTRAPSSVTATCRYVRGHGPKGGRDANISNVSAQSMSCTLALKSIYKGHFTKSNFVTPDFGCHEKLTHSGGTTTGGKVSCKASPGYGGHGDFSFSWAA
jgi:hypothetical protein